jgi:hypothetical protein
MIRATFTGMTSQILAATSDPPSVAIARMPLGDVTLGQIAVVDWRRRQHHRRRAA